MPNFKKSISEHVANGTYRRDRHGDQASEVIIDQKLPPCPDYLDPVAADEWSRIVKIFADKNVLRATDFGVVTLYCHMFSKMRHALTNGDVDGLMTPAWITQFRQLSQELGLTPVSRAKLKNDGKDVRPSSADPYADF